jgi:hypothetical protein
MADGLLALGLTEAFLESSTLSLGANKNWRRLTIVERRLLFAGHGRAGPGKAGQGEAGRGKVFLFIRFSRAWRGGARQGGAGLGWARQGKARRGLFVY